MKRMNEVFELPVNHESFAVDGHTARNGEGLTARLEADLHAAHAINNVDALADALAGLMNDIGGGQKVCGHDFSCICAMDKARAALNDYRGEK